MDAKQAIYQLIADSVKAKTGKNIGRSGGQELFNLVVEQIFAAAVKEQTFRFNGGYGSLRIKHYSAGSRQLPSGAKTTFGERSKLRYEQGVSTTDLVEGRPVKTQVVPAPAAAAPATPAAEPAAVPAAAGSAVNLD